MLTGVVAGRLTETTRLLVGSERDKGGNGSASRRVRARLAKITREAAPECIALAAVHAGLKPSCGRVRSTPGSAIL